MQRESIPVISTETVRRGIMTLLLLLLPFFGQSFHYMKGLPFFWAASKAFPIVTLPLAFLLLRYPRMPMTRQVLLTFLWCLLVPSVAAIFYFGQDFFTGVGAQVKTLPMMYFYSFLGFLFFLRPTLREIEISFIILGIFTYALLIALWEFVPSAWYSGQYAFGSSPLFSADHRGHRIRMPMYFGMIVLFYCYRRFLAQGGIVSLLGLATGFILTLWVVKTRAMVVGIAVVIVYNSFRAAGPLLRFGLLLLIPAALIGLFSIDYLSTMFSVDSSTGFDVRWVTAMKAVEFLGANPFRWLFGVGTISPTSQESLFSYFGHFFFLADITWLGIIFEYGVVGALLLFLYEVRVLLFYRRLQQANSIFLGSLFDYVVYVLAISNLYPPTLSPGETAVIMSIFVYVWYRLKEQGGEQVDEEATLADEVAA